MIFGSRIGTFLHCTRLTSLVTAVVIVIGSLCFYSSNSMPINVTTDDLTQDSKTWIIQSVTDRRLISTLVAAQASIFCPLFVLLSPPGNYNASTTMVESICQLLMPVGLALSWVFSILFDMKTTDLIGQGNMCLLQDIKSCVLFGFVYGLKYAIVVLFFIETLLVFSLFFSKNITEGKVQLPLEKAIDSNC